MEGGRRRKLSGSEEVGDFGESKCEQVYNITENYGIFNRKRHIVFLTHGEYLYSCMLKLNQPQMHYLLVVLQAY